MALNSKHDRYEQTLKGRYRKFLNRYKKYGETNITFLDFCTLLSYDCFYCGAELPPKGYGLDRVDNTKGYVLENVVPCCSTCNRMKSNHSLEDFFSHIKKILTHNKKFPR